MSTLPTCPWSVAAAVSLGSVQDHLYRPPALPSHLRYILQLLLALWQAVVGTRVQLVVLVVIFNFHLLFRSHTGAATKSDFHCVYMCVCVRDWEAVIFALKTDFVTIFNTCVNIRLDYCIILYKDKMRDRIFFCQTSDIFSINIWL